MDGAPPGPRRSRDAEAPRPGHLQGAARGVTQRRETFFLVVFVRAAFFWAPFLVGVFLVAAFL